MIYAGKEVGLFLGIPNNLYSYDRESFMVIITVVIATITIAIVPVFIIISIIANRPPIWIPTPYASTSIIKQVKQ